MSRFLSRARQPLPLLLLLLAATLAVRLPGFGQSIWFDEACMANQRVGPWAILLKTIYRDIHPPLYIIFMHFWNAVFGDSEVSMRIPPLLCGLASIPLTHAVGARMVGRSGALWAALLMCLSPVHIWYSIEARLYAPMVVSVLAGVWLLHRLLDGSCSRWMWVLFGMVLLTMISLHYYLNVYVLLLACLGYVVSRFRARPEVGRRMLMWYGGVPILLTACWVALKFTLADFDTSQGYLRPFTLAEFYRVLFQWFWTGDCIQAGLAGPTWHPRWVLWVLFQLLGVVLFLRGLLDIFRSRGKRPEAGYPVAYLFALPAFLFVLPWIGFPDTYIERSVLPALPFFFLIVAVGLTSIAPRWLRIAGSAAVVAMCAANLTAYFEYDDRWTVYKPHQDWRAAAHYLGEEIDAGGAGRPVFTTMPNPRSLSYYDDRIQLAPYLDSTMHLFERSARIFEERLGKSIGRRLADFTRSVAVEYDRTKAALRAGTRLLVHPIVNGTLPGEGPREGVFYLVKNHWHPPRDTTIDTLVANPRFRPVEIREYRGVTVYKMRESD